MKKKSKANQLKTVKESLFIPPVISIYDNVISFLFKQQNDLSKAFLALNMKYEQSKLNGKLRGLNVPLKFYKENKTIENEAEIYVDESISRVLLDGNDIQYIIASLQNDKSTLMHEYAHAYYYLHPDYQSLVDEYYIQLDKKIRLSIEKDLEMRGYHTSVYQDEFQAYLLESDCDFGKRFQSVLNPIHAHFRQIVKVPEFKNYEFVDVVEL